MTFARRNCLTTHFSERTPVVKRRMAVFIPPRRDSAGCWDAHPRLIFYTSEVYYRRA